MNSDFNTACAPDTSPRMFDLNAESIGRPSGVNCPTCEFELMMGQLESNSFAGCTKCGGMLFQQETFGTMIQHLRAASTLPTIIPQPLDTDELKVRRQCPSCLGGMETHAYAGPGNAVIDTCFPCRLIWFDAGELTKLVQAPGKR